MEDKHLPLPEGVERVYKCSRTEGDLRAYPGRYFLFASASPEWSNAGAACDESACTSDMDPVYHVPAPAKIEHQAPSSPEIEQERPQVFKQIKPLTKHEALYDAARRFVKSSRFEPDSTIQQALAEAVRQLTPVRDDPVHDTHARPKIEHQAPPSPEIEQEQLQVFKVLPPLEIADHAEALGWTPESRVWKSSYGTIRVNPSGKALDDGDYTWNHPESDEKCKNAGDTLLPNRRVPVEGEPIAAKAGRCAWCGYTIHDMGVRTGGRWYHNECAPSPRPAKSAGEVAEEVAREIQREVDYDTTDGFTDMVKIITAAIERERAANLAIPATDSGKSAR